MSGNQIPTMNRIQRLMQSFDCSQEDAIRYLDLREEGYSQYQAAVMAGLRDPDEVRDSEGEAA